MSVRRLSELKYIPDLKRKNSKLQIKDLTLSRIQMCISTKVNMIFHGKNENSSTEAKNKKIKRKVALMLLYYHS